MEMDPRFEKINLALQKFGSFSTQEIEWFNEKLSCTEVQKGELIFPATKIWQNLFFINEGAIRQYEITHDGLDMTVNFFCKNDWVLDHESFTTQTVSNHYFSAFIDCELIYIEHPQLHDLLSKSQAFLRIGKVLNQVLPPTQIKGKSLSPEQKYQWLLSERPHLLQIFPLKFIASFLDLTPETLSRVRRKMIS